MVVKVGSSSLTQPSGHLDVKKLNSLVAALSAASAQGARVVLVSSGAIAAGFGPLGFESRPSDVATQQAVAAADLSASLGEPRLRLQLQEGEAWVYPQLGLTAHLRGEQLQLLRAVPRRLLIR